jgi:tripartite-type tricarboxylate transporter receptor subunit TctC
VTPSRRFGALAGAAIAALISAGPALAQDYPTRPIRLVVAFAPGGNTDFIARLLSEKVKTLLGQSIIIDNKPGANGAIGAENVARSEPDGYSLFLTTVGAVAINPAFRKDLRYDPVKDFAPVALLGRVSPVLVVNPSTGINSAAELVAKAKQKPDTITVGITGVGAISHLGLELFESAAGVKLVHVPYRGSGPALSDLLGGQVNGIIIDVAVMLEHIKAGKLKTLGVTSATRSEFLPDIPTFVEQGYADVVADNWTALFAPARTPPAIVAKLNGAFTAALSDPEMRRKLGDSALSASPSTPDQLGQLLKSEIARWNRVIREKGIIIKPED